MIPGNAVTKEPLNQINGLASKPVKILVRAKTTNAATILPITIDMIRDKKSLLVFL